jgi:hypothetical protein
MLLTFLHPDLGRRRPGRLEDGRKVSDRLFGRGLDAVTDSTRSGVDSRGPGAEHEAARNDRMAVRAERCREQAADYGLSGHGFHLS